MDPIEDMQCNIAQDLGSKTVPKEPEMEPEKVDLSPENSKKSDNSPTGDQISRQKLSDEADGGGGGGGAVEKVQYSNCNLHSGISECVNKSMSMQEVKEKQRCASEDPEVRNALAFTIDFGEGRKSVDVQRHEKMLERFQNRHKRGVSLSKLETNPVSSVGKVSIPQSANLPRKQKIISSETPTSEVKLRDKNRSLKDSSSKRHSWSPRTSMAEATSNETAKPLKSNKFTPKSSTLQMAFENQNVVKDYCSSSEINAESLDSSIGLPCIEPPLQNFKSDDNDDSVSEAGTYTLDGDNYTEEQKERMNIDKIPAITESTSSHFFKSEHKPPQRPTNFQDDLEVIDLTEQPSSYKAPDDRKMNNVLEVSYFHDPMVVHPVKQKQSYLEKLKSRVKNITHKAKSPEKQIQMNSPDQGTFTSVTTSGILSVKPSLENHPRMHRRNSLTKSYVDSSEYVQGVAKLNILSKGEAKILNCYTDTEKASGVQDMGSPYENSRRKPVSDASVISSAVSKKDWIQEWAKTAREYSNSPAVGTSSNTGNSQMTRSYDFEHRNQFGYDFDIDMTKSDYYDAKKYEEFGDNLDRYQFRNRKQLDHLINNSNNNNNSSSDPTMKQHFSNENNSVNEFTRHGSIRQHSRANASKPPMSPSKIPSPIGSVGRARSVSRNRSLQGSNSDLSTNETEMYLQKTAAAISTLQNIHRRNSIRGTTQQHQHNSSHSSPLSPGSRRMSPKISPMNSFQSPVHNLYNDRALSIEGGATLSPQHQQQMRNIKQQQMQHQSALNHKRNLSLDDSDSYVNVLSSLEYGNQMSNSLNTDNANAILDFKRQHTRHNSFEGMSTLPPKPVKCFQNFDQATAYYSVKSHNEAGMYDEDENEKNDKNLRTLTAGVKGLSLGTMKSNEHRISKGPSPSVGKSAAISMKAVGASSTSRPTVPKTPSNQMSSPIKRSSSFSVKAMKPTTPTLTPKLGSRPAMSNTKIQKSASSTSFKKIVANFKDDEDDFYINNDDDLELNPEYSSNSEFSDDTEETEKEPITNTRYNKTFLMRMEQNKKLSAAGKQGAAACPNTPELPRRTLQIKGATRDRASMPRDSSLNRMKQDLNISRKSVSKELAFKEPTPANKQKVQPKYLDISKYKAPSASNFLKKDESKSYLAKTEVKKSPSSASIALGRTEHNRMSTRSVKSAGAKLPNVKKEAPRNTKEQELEMWRRRASYDPMKAAQEGKRKQEEAKRQTVSRQMQQQPAERPSNFNESSVLRSKSYHGGVGMAHSQHGSSSSNTNTRGAIDHADMAAYGSSQPHNNRWTFTSTESSEEYEDEYVN